MASFLKSSTNQHLPPLKLTPQLSNSTTSHGYLVVHAPRDVAEPNSGDELGARSTFFVSIYSLGNHIPMVAAKIPAAVAKVAAPTRSDVNILPAALSVSCAQK